MKIILTAINDSANSDSKPDVGVTMPDEHSVEFTLEFPHRSFKVYKKDLQRLLSMSEE